MTVAQSIVGDGDNREKNDNYPTHPSYTQALLDREAFSGIVWECACGAGDMSEVLIKNGLRVKSTNLHDYGYGDVGVDFLTTIPVNSRGTEIGVAHIITNPPFSFGLKFAKHALECVVDGGKVALLLPLSFLEGTGRREFLQKSGLIRVHVFSARLRFDANFINPKRSGGMKAFAWFIWQKGYEGPTEIKWI